MYFLDDILNYQKVYFAEICLRNNECLKGKKISRDFHFAVDRNDLISRINDFHKFCGSSNFERKF